MFSCQNRWWDLCPKYYKNIKLIFICFLYYAKEDRVVENIESDAVALKIVTTTQKSHRRRQ